MSPTVVGTFVGVLVSAFCSLVGAVIARGLGGDYATSAILVHAAAGIVLLVNILARMEARSS
jgi:hypothetical protein